MNLLRSYSGGRSLGDPLLDAGKCDGEGWVALTGEGIKRINRIGEHFGNALDLGGGRGG